MMNQNEKKQVKQLEAEYIRLEEKALNCSDEKAEKIYIDKMSRIQDEISYIAHKARKRKAGK